MNLGAEITIFKTDCLWRAWYLKVIPNKNSTNRKKYKILKLWWGDPKILMCHGRLDYSLVNIHSLSPMKQIISLALLILGLATWPAWDKGIWEAVTVFQPLRGLDALSFLSASSLRKTYPGYPLFPGSQAGYADHSYGSCLTDPSPKRSHPGWPTTMTINIYSCMPLASYGYLLYTLLSLWILFANISSRIFASMFMKDNRLSFFFLVMSLSGFGIWVMLALQNELGSSPILWICFWWLDFHRKVGRISTCSENMIRF